MSTFPDDLLGVLPADTVATWLSIAPLMPSSAYLVGGTALTVHFRHRISRDLDFFLERTEDLDGLLRSLQGVGALNIELLTEGSLNCVFNKTKLQLLDASSQHRLFPTTNIEGIQVAAVEDILATKLQVILRRGELRDYFDLMTIEQSTNLRIETNIDLVVKKYELSDKGAFIAPMGRALGHLDDVEDDPFLPIGRIDIENYWRRRSREIVRHFNR